MTTTTLPTLPEPDTGTGAGGADGGKLTALLLLAHKMSRVGDPKRAIELGMLALDLADARSDAFARAQAIEVVADAHLAVSAHADALARHLEAVALWRALGNVHGQVRCLRGIATVELYVGDYAQALGRFEEALQLLRAAPDAALEAGVFHGLGMVHSRRGELAKAREYHDLSLARRRELDDQAGAAASLNSLGVLCLRVGQQRQAAGPATMAAEFRRARTYFDEAEQLAARVGDLHLQALALGNIGSAIAFLGDLEQAMEMFERQLVTVRAIGDRQNESLCLANIGEVLRLCGRPEAAIEPLQRALAVGEEIQSRSHVMRAHQELSACREAQGDAAAALRHYKLYHELDQALRSEEVDAKAHDLLAQIAVRRVREEAESYRAERDRLAEANVQLSAAANIDALTGLANRRYLDANLEHMVASLRASRHTLSVALADIDNFKRINDRYSHVIGDEVLRAVGRILRAACRPSDLAVRYGGEEFVLALPDTTLEHARAACERLRTAVADYPWQEIHEGLQVTISIGVAGATAQDDATQMLAAADRQLYAAKRAGRNCVR